MVTRAGVKNVVTVDSGSKALKELQKERYDLVISDIWMPGTKDGCCFVDLGVGSRFLFYFSFPEMSGTELCSTIFERKDLAHMPVVVGLTAETSEALQRRCQSSGMSYVMHKPITASQVEQFLSTTFPQLERRKMWAPKGSLSSREIVI